MDSITSELEDKFSFMSLDDTINGGKGDERSYGSDHRLKALEPWVEKIKESTVSGVVGMGSDVSASSSFLL